MMASLRLNVTIVAIGGRGLMIEGEPGSGKTSLALALIDRGAVLIGDDGVILEARDGAIWAAPPERHAGKIEVRGVGLVELPTTSAPLSLILAMDEEAPRAPSLGSRMIMGGEVPCLTFRTGDPVQALRAEYALARFGID